MKAWPVALGVGMAAGAVASMMLPRRSKVQRMVSHAADRVEDAAEQVAELVMDEFS